MFELAKNGKTPTQIARIMTKKGIKLPCDVVGNTHTRTMDEIKRRWNRNTVKRILVNPVYLGCVVNGKLRKINYKSKKIMLIPKEDWIVVPNMHEAIIDRETFDLVQAQIKARTSTRTNKHEWLLCGLLKCAECGKNLSISYWTSKYTGKKMFYTACNTYRIDSKLGLCTPHSNNLEKLTEVIVERIRTTCKKYVKLQKTEYKKIVQEEDRKLKQEINNSKNEEGNLKKQIALLENKIKTTYNDKVNGVIDEKLFIDYYNELNADKKNLQNRLKIIQESKIEKEQEINFDKIVEDFINQKKVSREILVQLVDKITITQDKVITIYYKFNILNKLDDTDKEKNPYVDFIDKVKKMKETA